MMGAAQRRGACRSGAAERRRGGAEQRQPAAPQRQQTATWSDARRRAARTSSCHGRLITFGLVACSERRRGRGDVDDGSSLCGVPRSLSSGEAVRFGDDGELVSRMLSAMRGPNAGQVLSPAAPRKRLRVRTSRAPSEDGAARFGTERNAAFLGVLVHS